MESISRSFVCAVETDTFLANLFAVNSILRQNRVGCYCPLEEIHRELQKTKNPAHECTLPFATACLLYTHVSSPRAWSAASAFCSLFRPHVSPTIILPRGVRSFKFARMSRPPVSYLFFVYAVASMDFCSGWGSGGERIGGGGRTDRSALEPAVPTSPHSPKRAQRREERPWGFRSRSLSKQQQS